MNESNYMATQFKNYLGTRKLSKSNDFEFLRLFSFQERNALTNNLQIAEWGRCQTDNHSSFLSNGTGYTIAKALNKKIVGNGLFIEGDNDRKKGRKLVDLVGELKLKKALKKLFSQSISRGAALLKIDFSKDNIPQINSMPLGRYKVDCDEYGKIIEANTFLSIYSNEKDNSHEWYCLVEHRFFESGTPKIRYEVVNAYRSTVDLDEYNLHSLKGKEIPKNISDRFSRYDFNKTYEIPLKDSLGLYIVMNTEENTLYPSMQFGDSQFLPAIDELWACDHSLTAKENDKYIGRGRVIVPKTMSAPIDTSNAGSSMAFGLLMPGQKDAAKQRFASAPLDSTFFTEVNNISLEAQKPVDVQFALRTAEWLEDKKDAVASACIACGISPEDVDGRLANGYKNEAEINAQNSLTRSTVEDKRDLASDSINQMLNDFAFSLGLKGTYFISWSVSGLVNQEKNAATVISLYNSGLISIKRALKQIHPDWNSSEIEEEEEALKSSADDIIQKFDKVDNTKVDDDE